MNSSPEIISAAAITYYLCNIYALSVTAITYYLWRRSLTDVTRQMPDAIASANSSVSRP